MNLLIIIKLNDDVSIPLENDWRLPVYIIRLSILHKKLLTRAQYRMVFVFFRSEKDLK